MEKAPLKTWRELMSDTMNKAELDHVELAVHRYLERTSGYRRTADDILNAVFRNVPLRVRGL